jgi:hypothetical protein
VEPSTPLSAPRCQRESTEFGADGGVIRVRQQSGEATAGSITGGHPIWPGDQWLRWSVAACPRTPPSLRIRTAGLKTHRHAAPAHWPLGRRERSLLRLSGTAVGLTRPPCTIRRPRPERGGRGGVWRARGSVTWPICEKRPSRRGEFTFSSIAVACRVSTLPGPSGQPRSGTFALGQPAPRRQESG